MARLKSYLQKELIEAGCDEAGRGSYAGPVFAAAVILPYNFRHKLLNDSKLMKPEHRYELRAIIQEKAISYAVGMVDVQEIDNINILKASFRAMHLALEKLNQEPQLLLIDGNRFYKYREVPHQCIIKGDGKYASIAAASVLAKTYRDDYMIQLHEAHPHYQWKTNKGYGTLEHRAAIEVHGLCDYHRRSFNISPEEEIHCDNVIMG